jgi:hypothetical protein
LSEAKSAGGGSKVEETDPIACPDTKSGPDTFADRVDWYDAASGI